MKVFITLLLFLFSLSVLAQRGGIKFKIKDEQNFNLPGASIALLPGRHGGTTNQAGELVLTGITPGEYKIVITYIGFETAEKAIVVTNSLQEQTITLRFRSTLSQEVVVTSDRLPGQARALNQQRNNLNLSNIISADQIGRFPDANIGDAIKRVPGVTMQNDQGEARNIIIRGMGPELNAVSLNGERIPSAEGDNRRVQMDLVPSDMIQTVVVNKTLTADVDADAIGGSVNLITRAPLNGLRISGTLAGGFSPIRNGFIGTANFVAGNRFAENKLGVIVSGSYNTNDYGSDNVEAVWNKDATGKLYIADHDIRSYDVKRIRRALATTLDYKINPKNTIYLTGSYNWRDDKEKYEEDFNAKLNFEIPASLIKMQTGALKFGGRLRAKIKNRSNTFFSYEPTESNEGPFENISLLPLIDKTNTNFYPGSRFRAARFIDSRFLGDLSLKDAAAFEESDEPAEYLAGNYNAKETITAGYVQLTQKLSQTLTAVAGLRMEHMRINYTGNIVEDEDDLKGQATLKNNYTDLLPGINLRYEGAKNLIVRLAWTNALARPKYYDLVPYFNVNPNDLVLSSGNPALKPIKSTNFDLMTEKYFKSIGLLSGGIFYKHLNNFFYAYRDDNFTSEKFSRDFADVANPIIAGERYEFFQPRNGDAVNVYGFEVAVQRQLDFLTGF